MSWRPRRWRERQSTTKAGVMARILVINPNSSAVVTAAMDLALDPLRAADGPEIVCVTNRNGPAGIESQADADLAAVQTAAMVAAASAAGADAPDAADAYVIACFSDPGLAAAREATDKPVFGIAECGVLAALGHGAAVGVIAILSTSVARHWRYFRSLGLDRRIAGDRPIEMGVAALSDADTTRRRLIEVGTCLRDVDGAGALVLGCAGMAAYRGAVERAVGLPVIDPTQAAVAIAATSLRLRAAG